MTAQLTAHPAGQATPAARRVSFGRLIRAEWTKFRSVRGWVIGMIVAAILAALIGVFAGANASIGCGSGPNGPQLTGKACLPKIPIGPGGEAVSDSFYFVHQPLTGNGSITVRVTSLTGRHSDGNGPVAEVGQAPAMTPGLVPWAKAGIIIKASTKQGSAYAAMMVTGSHGVRMQYDYIHDVAGLAGSVTTATPRWLRLTRSGDAISGYDSANGRNWTLVGTATLAGLPATVQAGPFAAAPQYIVLQPFFGGASIQSGPSQATGNFSDVSLRDNWPAGRWAGSVLGSGNRADYPTQGGGWHQSGGQIRVTGSGDIAPAITGPGGGFPGNGIEQSLAGMFAAVIAVGVVAAMFFTAEYRRGLIRLTFAAMPGRGRVLAAKAIVIGLVAFAAGLAASIASIALGVPREQNEGLYILPVSWLTEFRVIAGTAALVALVGVIAVAVGAILRRSAAAVATVIVAVVLPYILAVAILPTSAADWVLRLTPAAGFAIEQSIPHYPQINAPSSPAGGVYPLAPWAGFGVLCAWAAAALALAFWQLRRRDA